MIVGLIVGAFFGIGYLFYLGTAVGVSAGIIGVILVLLVIGAAGGCNYFMETSSSKSEPQIYKNLNPTTCV